MSMDMLVLELHTEELPPRALKAMGEAFASRVFESLVRRGLCAPGPERVRAFATPRRLAVSIAGVLPRAEDRVETRKLMPAKVAFEAGGARSAALRKRLEKEGMEDPENAPIERRLEAGVESVYLTRTLAGQSLAQGLQAALDEAIAGLPIPKTMAYQLADGETTVRFVRPAHGLLALHGEAVVPVAALGLASGRVTHGHRFQGVADIEVASAQAYEEALRAHGKVIASFDERRAEIDRQLRACAAAAGASLGPEDELRPLLDEVTALVEWPKVYATEFEPEFLVVPQECLILTMRQNQKYFPLFGADGKLTNRFLLVSNMDVADPRNIVEGNRRVVRPRLADARFFFETDKKKTLEARVPQLASVVYHNKLGSQLDRVGRVQRLAGSIARLLGVNQSLAERAAGLAKADLATLMVGEFPELQGVMGRYYALSDGEDPRVANAIEEHYRPRFSGDSLPSEGVAVALALADKLETLAGMFGAGQQPTGDKDPFALRRHALGVIRLLVEGRLALSLSDLSQEAFAVFPQGMIANAQVELETFVLERLRGYLREAGYSAIEIESVLCMHPVRLDQVPVRLDAVRQFARLPEAESLSAANKRVANILKQAESKGESFGRVEARGLKEPAERALFEALKTASARATPLFESGDYAGYLKAFAVLKAPVDAFFDSIMVMADDPAVRRNRLALLADLRREMNRVADISKLAA
jgi:glycyl-tRNA synthetase beta chain